MTSPNDEVRFQLEVAYRKHLEGLLAKHGSKGAVFAAVQTNAKTLAKSRDSSSLMSVAYDLTPDMVRGWMGKYAKLPSHPFILESLTQVVETSLPEQLNSFQETVEKLRQIRLNSQKAAKGNVERAKLLALNGHLAFEPVSSHNLKLESLALGSWLCAGAPPPYADRDVDSQILAAIDNEDSKLLVLKGSPKSGKTRTLIENIRKSRHRDSPIYWLTPTAEALDEFIKSFSPSPQSVPLIVLDDIQRFQPCSQLTVNRLNSLKQRGRVLCTIHESSIDSWRLQNLNHEPSTSLGPPDEVIEMIDSASIFMSSEFNEGEIAAAQSNLKLAEFDDSDYLHFPSWAASVEQLTSLAKSMGIKTFNKAVLSSILDARVLFPGGTDIDTLATLAKSRYRELTPNGVWLQSAWESALEMVTNGLSAGSRHAILMRTTEFADTFLILDALWEHLRPDDWKPPKLDELGLTRFDAAQAASDVGLYSSAIDILTQDLESLDSVEMELLADLYSFEKAYKEARNYYEQALLLGRNEARRGLGNLEFYGGNFEDAEKHYLEYLSPGAYDEFLLLSAIPDLESGLERMFQFFERLLSEVPSDYFSGGMIFNLANSLFRDMTYSAHKVALDIFELLYSASTARGFIDLNLNPLGVIQMYRRNFDESAELFKRAGESGDYAGFRNLGIYFLRKKKPEEALKFLDLSLELRLKDGDEEDGYSLLNRVIILDLLGKPKEAGRYLKRALKRDSQSEFLTLLIAGSFSRRYEGGSADWQELYTRARNTKFSIHDYGPVLEYETVGWWDKVDKDFIQSTTGWVVEPLVQNQASVERNLNGTIQKEK